MDWWKGVNEVSLASDPDNDAMGHEILKPKSTLNFKENCFF